MRVRSCRAWPSVSLLHVFELDPRGQAPRQARDAYLLIRQQARAVERGGFGLCHPPSPMMISWGLCSLTRATSSAMRSFSAVMPLIGLSNPPSTW